MASRKDKTKSSKFRAVLRLQSDFNVLLKNGAKQSLPDFLYDHFTMGQPYELGDDCVGDFKKRQDVHFCGFDDVDTINTLKKAVGHVQSEIGYSRDALIYQPRQGLILQPIIVNGEKQTHFMVENDAYNTGKKLSTLYNSVCPSGDIGDFTAPIAVLAVSRLKQKTTETIMSRYSSLVIEPIFTSLVVQQDILNHEGHIIQSRDVVTIFDNGGEAAWHLKNPFDYMDEGKQPAKLKRPDGRGCGSSPTHTKLVRSHQPG